MCPFISNIRQLIGKNTKFRFIKGLKSLPFNLVFFSCVVIFCVQFIPVADTVTLFTAESSTPSTRIVRSPNILPNEHTKFWQHRLEGVVTQVTLDQLDYNSDVKALRNFIKKQIQQYKSVARNVYSLNEDSIAQFPRNEGNLSRTFGGRHRREVIFADELLPDLDRGRRKILNVDTEGPFIINSVDRSSSQHYVDKKAIDINCQQVQGKTYVFSIEEAETNERKLMIYELNDRDLKQRFLTSVNAPGAVAVEVFHINDELFSFVTVKHEPQSIESPNTINTGSTLYRINLADKTAHFTQNIHMPFSQSSIFWSGVGKEVDDKFLVIAPTKAITETGTSFDVMVACYRWQGAYFDYVSEFPAQNPQSVTHFNMLSRDYLAVANYQDDTGSTSITSEIFKYQYSEGVRHFVSFQKILTHGAKDIKHFTLDGADGSQQHFLAIANSCMKDKEGRPQFLVESTIMKYGEDHFLPFKSLHTYGAQQFLAVNHDDVFYLAMADLHGIRMLQFNGWTFVETFYVKYETEQTSPFSLKLRNLNQKDASYMTLASKTTGVQNGMFTIDFESKNDHLNLITQVGLWCNAASSVIDSNRKLQLIEEELSEAPKITDKRVDVKGIITFRKGVHIDQLNSQELRIRGRARSLGLHEHAALSNMENRYSVLNQRLDTVKSSMDNVVWIDKDQEIHGPVFIENMAYENEKLLIKDLQIKKLGDITVSDHLDNLVFLNKPQHLQRIITRNIEATDLSIKHLNDHPLVDYALRHPSSKQVFVGNNEFLSEVNVMKSIKVKDRFAGLSFSRPNFLLVQGNQTFTDLTMGLSNTEVKNLYTRMLNGHDIFLHFLDAVPLTGGVIKTEKRFKHLEISSLSVNTINNMNINNMFDSAVYTDRRFTSQVFSSPKYFENMVVRELNPTNRDINEQFDLSWNFINIDGENEYNLKNLKIAGETNVGDVVVKKQLNNIKVTDMKMDVFMKNSENQQHIKAKKLKAVKFNTHVEAPHKVSGIDLQNWSEVQRITLSNNVIEGKINVPGNIDLLDNQINAVKTFHLGESDVLSVLKQSARLDAAELPSNCMLEMESLLVEGNSDVVGLINDHVKPSQWVINSEQKDIISGEKTFTGPVHIVRDIDAEALYGTEDKKENLLDVFPTLLLDDTDQTISQQMTFTKNFRVDKASCTKCVLDDVEFSDVLFKNGDQIVEVPSTFRQQVVTTGETSVLEDVTAHFVNDININDQLKDTLRTDQRFGTQIITAPYSFVEMSTKEATVEGAFADSDVHSLFGNIISKNDDQIKLSNSDLTFAKETELDQLNFIGHVNGIPTSEWGKSWMLSNTDQDVHSKIEFVGPVTSVDLNAPTVNNVDIRQLSDDIVRIDRDETFERTFVFNGPVDVDSGVMMPDGASLDGMDLRREVLLKNHPNLQTVTGSNKFMKGMSINGHLSVEQIPNFDVSNFAKLLQSNGVESRSEQEPASLIIKGNAHFESEPNFNSRINEHNWQDVLDSIWFRDQDVVLQHPVKFSSLTLEKGGVMEDKATLNSLNLKDFQANYASKSRDNVWTEEVAFSNVDNVNSIMTESLILENGGGFNGEDINEFYDSVLRYTGDQVIRGAIKSQNFNAKHLETTEGASLNSVDFKDFMTVTGTNHLRAAKNFDNIIIKNIVLSPTTVIDGVNMGNWNENAVRREGNHEIKGPIEFVSLQTTENVMVEGLVDGVKFDESNILLADKNQEIFGDVVVKQSDNSQNSLVLKAPAGLVMGGNLDGINVKDSISKLVFKNVNDESPIFISGETVFDAPVILNQVKTEALLQGQDVSTAMGNFKRASEEMSSIDFVAGREYRALANIASKMVTASENMAIFLDYYVLTQTIQVRSTYVKVLDKVGYPALAMGFKKSEFITTEHWWAFNAPLDYYQLQVGNRVEMEGTVVDMTELQHDKGNFIAYAVNNEGSGRPAQAALEVISSINNFEMNKSPDKLSKTFVLKNVDVGTPNVRPAISQIIYSNSFRSIRAFSVSRNMGQASCMIATTQSVDAAESTTGIYCLDKDNGMLNKIQEIKFDSPSLTTAVTVFKHTLLGILTRSENAQPEGLLEIWRNVDKDGALTFVKQNCLPVFNAISMDTLSTQNGKPFLAVASGALPLSDYQGSVFIYRYSVITQKFTKTQTIECDHPLDVKLQWLKPSNEIVAYILSKSVKNNVLVYKYKGVSGWQLVHKFTSENGKSLQVTDFIVDNQYRAQLLVTSPTDTKIYAAEFKGLSTSLGESMEGQTSFFQKRLDVNNL